MWRKKKEKEKKLKISRYLLDTVSCLSFPKVPLNSVSCLLHNSLISFVSEQSNEEFRENV